MRKSTATWLASGINARATAATYSPSEQFSPTPILHRNWVIDVCAVIQPLPRLQRFRDRQTTFCGKPNSRFFWGAVSVCFVDVESPRASNDAEMNGPAAPGAPAA
jgi:hypothetical protein